MTAAFAQITERRDESRGFNVTGNTIFDWGVCPRLKYGIREDKASFKNVITGNNVNCYEGADLHCQG